MTERINPVHARLYPEILPEAITVTASPSGTPIASYAKFSPYVVILNSLFTDVTQDVVLRVGQDSAYATLQSEGEARSNREEATLEIPCASALDLWAKGAISESSRTAYTMRITKPTILEKIKYGYSLSTDERALADQFGVSKMFKSGLMKVATTPMYREVLEVAEKVSVTAGGNTQVGSLINVRAGQKAVILSIGTDYSHSAVVANSTFITVNRDISDKAYVKLDTFAMPGLNHDINCYIPGIDRLEVILESAVVITDMPVRYKYAISDLTIMEKIRWNVGLTADESAIANEMDLYNAIATGVV